ncbi:GDCCVxC domain-containing (seleno)protein [Alteromonas oceanisediminis]|uniref:GDCCVxC domain-containing (seleno)protein n=1 Tax=Alteromonas oceanisediminis TaxID=2836180 RepID=UPI002023A818|nr:GDCCVxC domain-containing (seleno)protein [Alteromonas oceanisediminis]
MPKIELSSTITCPRCSYRQQEQMPTTACQFFYECINCKSLLKPLSGDCCVYCSYGTVKCPPMQEDNSCCNQKVVS